MSPSFLLAESSFEPNSSPINTPTFSNTVIRGRWTADSTIRKTIRLARQSNPSVPKTSRSGGRPNGSWEFLLHLPPFTPGGIALSDWETRSLCRQSRNLVSPGDGTFGPGSYWDGWRGAEVLLPNPCKRTQFNQTWRGSRSHQRSQFRLGSGPGRYLKQGLEIFHKCKSTPELSLSLKRGRIRHCTIPSGH